MRVLFSAKVREIKPELMKQALIKSAQTVEADAKDICPKKHGRLAASITSRTEDYKSDFTAASPAEGYDAVQPDESDRVSAPTGPMIAKIGTNVNYAADVEYGNDGKYRYLRRALYQRIRDIKKIFQDALHKSVEGK